MAEHNITHVIHLTDGTEYSLTMSSGHWEAVRLSIEDADLSMSYWIQSAMKINADLPNIPFDIAIMFCIEQWFFSYREQLTGVSFPDDAVLKTPD